MKRNELLNSLKENPNIIDISIRMNNPNSSILIFEGDYVLKSELNEIKINGKINFDWFPNYGAHFQGYPQLDMAELFSLIDDSKTVSLIIEGFEIGKGFITNTTFATSEGSSIRSSIMLLKDCVELAKV